MEQYQKENKMGTQPIGKLILRMSIPMMLSMLMIALYNIVDSIFVSRISENALTAVSLVFPFQMITVALGVGTGIGVNSLTARRLGEKNQEAAEITASHGQFLALISSIIFMAFGLIFSKPIMHAFTDVEEIAVLGTEYMTICCGFSIFAIFQMMIEKTLQATGSMVYSMLVQLIGAVVNLVLDPILIFGYLGLPAMGVAGAAIATVAGQFFGMVLGFILLFKNNKILKVRLRGFKPDLKVIKDIYAVGLPSIIMNLVSSLTTVCMNGILLVFTPTAVSVAGVFGKLQSFIFMPVFALNSGTMPVMAYNFGARNKKRVMQSLKYGCIYAFIVMIIGFAIFQIFPDQLLMMFDASENMLDIGMTALRRISICFPPIAFSILLSTLFQAVGKGFLSMFISCCRQLIILLPAAYLLSLTNVLDVVWYAYPIAEYLALLICLPFTKKVYNDRIEPLDIAVGEVEA